MNSWPGSCVAGRRLVLCVAVGGELGEFSLEVGVGGVRGCGLVGDVGVTSHSPSTARVIWR